METKIIQVKYPELTDEEIDSLVFEKWFGGLIDEMVALIEKPLKKEIEILKMLDDRYKSTLNDLDAEYKELEAGFESLLSELVRV